MAERLAEFLAVGAHAHRRSVTTRIRRAIEGHGIDVVFQPIVDLDGGGVVGMEALSRFRTHPPRPPDAWFAEAASVGLRTELELAAITLALAEMDRIPEQASMWLNASPVTLASPALAATLDRSPARRVVLEMTEHAPVTDYDELREMLRPLRDAGMALAIDDVGNGFASLGHIVRLGPDHVKLDRTLVEGVDPRADADWSPHVGPMSMGECPGAQQLPWLSVQARYPVVDASGYEVVSAPGRGPHADFWNTWRQRTLRTLVRSCLQPGQTDCATVST